jgi:6-pyruvoyltetrahydropterin/6-carboxytetrahydropterin synthase
MYRIRKRFKFEAAHALVDSWSTCCQVVHGHSYIVEVVIEGANLDAGDMLIDFGKLKKICQPAIDNLDHALVLHESQADLMIAAAKLAKTVPMRIVSVSYNPTAEMMAWDLFNLWKEAITTQTRPGTFLAAVRIHETDTGWAEYSK